MSRDLIFANWRIQRVLGPMSLQSLSLLYDKECIINLVTRNLESILYPYSTSMDFPQPAFTCSKLAIETLKQYVLVSLLLTLSIFHTLF